MLGLWRPNTLKPLHYTSLDSNSNENGHVKGKGLAVSYGNEMVF